MQLHPRESFSIVRQIEDHTDVATYYVRAVIRNAKTDAIIQVDGNNYLNLTDRGSQRFSQNWLVSADPSGQGFYVSILTSVYTDSGYTTKSQNYGDKMETYLVQDRINANLGGLGGGGGGADIDYVRIRKIVDEVVKERLAEDIEMPEMPEIPEMPPFPDFPDIETPLKQLASDIKQTIVNNKAKPTDLSALTTALEKVTGLLNDLKTTSATKDKVGEVYKCVEEIKGYADESNGIVKNLSTGTKDLLNGLIKIGFGGFGETLMKMHETVKKDMEDADDKPKVDGRITRIMSKK